MHPSDRTPDPTASFADLAALADPPLDRLAMLIGAQGARSAPGAGVVDPVDVDEQLARLDALADDFGGSTADELVGWMRVRGFRGNEDDYYDPENSFLHRVLDRGLGIPITLSVVAIEVGRRCGVHLVGVGLPGEFVVAERDAPDRFHNPFRGRSMTPEEVRSLVRRFVGPGGELTPAMRRPVGAVDIVRRMLANLGAVYGEREQLEQLRWVFRMQTALPGAAPDAQRHLAAVLARLGRSWEAIEVLEALRAAGAPSTDEQRANDERLLQHLRSSLN